MIDPSTGPCGDDAELCALREALRALQAALHAAAARAAAGIADVHADFADSALNLVHYLALRCHDLRPLQQQLTALGLSSLGRLEPHVLASLDAVIGVLEALTGHAPAIGSLSAQAAVFRHGPELHRRHTEALFGPAAAERGAHIMVTLPSEAADDPQLVRQLIGCGADCVRINCAHDDAAAWQRMIAHTQAASQALDRPCRIAMDLAGPKLRTGPLQPGPAVVRAKPQRDSYGRVLQPARIWLTAAEQPQAAPDAADASLPVAARWLADLQSGEQLTCTDARGARRRLQVGPAAAGGRWAYAGKTCYFVPGMLLRRAGNSARGALRDTAIGALPSRERPILLRPGDRLLVTRALQPGEDAVRDAAGQPRRPAHIACTLPEVLDQVAVGEPIYFDDGRIGGVIEALAADHVQVRITQARAAGSKLRADKGINLPDSRLKLAALTEKDLQDLRFVAQHADIVQLSFVNEPADVELLLQQLRALAPAQPAVVLKIETQRGFAQLPRLLLAAMHWPRCGVMIARGDLAVECGYQRLAEAQEEILWLCEAAHVPVIWATQVLESLAKDGLPSRAEITDAAMAHRAECVMLNKGPEIFSAVRVLDDILRRMQAHQDKKRALMRELRLAHALWEIDGVRPP